MAGHHACCLFAAELVHELRRRFLFPNQRLSLQCFCNILASHPIICSPDPLYPSDIRKTSPAYRHFESLGIIQAADHGVSADAFAYWHHYMGGCSDAEGVNFLSLCYCSENELPFRMVSAYDTARPGNWNSKQGAIEHFNTYLGTSKGSSRNETGLAQYLQVLIEVDVPQRLRKTQLIQTADVEESLRDLYDSLKSCGSVQFSLDDFVRANLPVRTDYIYITPDEMVELCQDTSGAALQEALAHFQAIPPTPEASRQCRDKALCSFRTAIRLAGFGFSFLDVVLKTLVQPPGMQDPDLAGTQMWVNRKLANRSAWLLTLSDFTERVAKTQE